MTDRLARTTALAGLAALALLPGTLAAQRITKDAPAPGPTTAPVSAADLQRRVYLFADDSMLGRAAGTVDNLRGTAYIEREVRRLGLVPAGDSGGSARRVGKIARSALDRWARRARDFPSPL